MAATRSDAGEGQAHCNGLLFPVCCLSAYARHYLQVLQELASDKGLERFRIEYEKLYRALKKSHGKLPDADSSSTPPVYVSAPEETGSCLLS